VKTLAPTVSATSPPRLPEAVEADLGRVEARLGEEIASREDRLHAIAAHLVQAGGKRIRPAVVLLVFHAAGGDGPFPRRDDAIEAAVALELIHSATLLHDDIIDGETRRGRPSALATYGAADTLRGRLPLQPRLRSARFAEVVRWAAEACVQLTEGEILQGRLRHDPAVTLDDYVEIIERKTASLFAAGARTAAHLAGAPRALVGAMAACGRHVGLAFQVSDDLLDVEGHPASTGKPCGIDLRDGNPTLPIVLALGARSELGAAVLGPKPSAADVDAGLGSSGAGVLELVAARRGARRAARAEIARLPRPPRAALETLALGLTQRAS
jgi:octaprenyl-diphosphate synthase